jgi:dihydrofolate synthase/folylpolyglutamate synthase
MSFAWFAQQEVDVAIIETGLGGRLDSTNIILPELSVITNIGFDHMNILGDTLEKIAAEKAGIIKENVPAIIGETHPQTLPVFEKKALEKSSPLTIATEQRQVTDWHWEENYLVAEIAEKHRTDHKLYQLDLNGIYQLKNLLTVLEACHQLKLKGWNLNEDFIKKGLKHVRKNTSFHGRWEIIHTQPLVVLDVAHNEDGISELVKQAEITTHRELHIIIGLVKDKEVEKILSLLPRHANYYFTKAHIPRAMDESDLSQKALLAGLQGSAWPDVNDALKTALSRSHHDDLVIICGSVFLVGEVIPGTAIGIKS